MAAEGSSGTPDDIKKLEVGDKTRTAMHADVMNQIIDRLNVLSKLTVAGNNGRLIWSEGNVVLQLNTTDECAT